MDAARGELGYVVPSDGGPVERMRVLRESDPGEVMHEVLGRIFEGESLGGVARDWGLPRVAFVSWVMDDERRREAYEAVLRARADELVHSSLTAETKDPAAHMLRVAGLWDRKRFGKGDDGASGLRVVVQRFAQGSDGVAEESVEVSVGGG